MQLLKKIPAVDPFTPACLLKRFEEKRFVLFGEIEPFFVLLKRVFVQVQLTIHDGQAYLLEIAARRQKKGGVPVSTPPGDLPPSP